MFYHAFRKACRCEPVLQCEHMRIFAVIAIAIFSLLSAGCDVRLQPSQQGEWSDYHDNAHKVTNDVTHPAEPAEK